MLSPGNDSCYFICTVKIPGYSKSWESPDEADIASRLFIQILFR